MAHIETRDRTKGRKSYIVRWREPGTGAKQHKVFHRYEDARSFRTEVESAVDRGEYVSVDRRKVPFNEYASEVLTGDWNLRDSTRYAYEKLYGKWIEHSLGPRPIGAITTSELRTFFGELTAGPAAKAAVYRLVAKVLNQAVADGLLLRSPLKPIPRPKADRREIHPTDPALVRLIADHADPNYRLPILLAGFAGLRAGEVGGLRVQDVDFHTSTITIRQAARSAGPKRMLGEVKTESSRRGIRIPDFLLQEIQHHIDTFGTAPDGRICRTKDEGLLSAVPLLKRLHSACRAAGQPLMRFHDLRHTCAAMLIGQGAHPKMIQAYLGHANISITLDLYGHLFPSLAEELAGKLDEVWLGTENVRRLA